MNIQIRSAEESDIPSLLAIYRPYVEETFISFEFDTPSETEFTQRLRRIKAQFPYLLAQQNDEILGYTYAAPFKERPAYAWSVETTIYLRRDCRGRGIGRALYQALETSLARQNVQNLNACIAYPHPESITFHTAMGFRMVGRFEACGFKLGAWRDMVWMEKHIGAHITPPPPLLPPEGQPSANGEFTRKLG